MKATQSPQTEQKQVVIYCRVSSETDRQNTERQELECAEWASLHGYHVAQIFTEHISGAKKMCERPQFVSAIDEACRLGALLVFSEVSRLGRSIVEYGAILADLETKKVNAYFLKENFYLLDEKQKITAFAKVMLTCFSIAADLERQSIYQRLESGKARKRKVNEARGLKPTAGEGRPKGTTKERAKYWEQYKEIIDLIAKGISYRDICAMKSDKVSYATVAKLNKMFAPEIKAKRKRLLERVS